MDLVLLLILHTTPILGLPQLSQMLCKKNPVSLAGLDTSFHLGIDFFFFTQEIHLYFAITNQQFILLYLLEISIYLDQIDLLVQLCLSICSLSPIWQLHI